MRDLVQKLPSGSLTHDQITSDDTIAAVLATLNEVIKKNAEFSRYNYTFRSFSKAFKFCLDINYRRFDFPLLGHY